MSDETQNEEQIPSDPEEETVLGLLGWMKTTFKGLHSILPFLVMLLIFFATTVMVMSDHCPENLESWNEILKAPGCVLAWAATLCFVINGVVVLPVLSFKSARNPRSGD